MAETVIVDKGKCLRCGSQTRRARFYSNHVAVIPEEHAMDLVPSYASCEAYVCMACGHVETFATTLEPFYKK